MGALEPPNRRNLARQASQRPCRPRRTANKHRENREAQVTSQEPTPYPPANRYGPELRGRYGRGAARLGAPSGPRSSHARSPESEQQRDVKSKPRVPHSGAVQSLTPSRETVETVAALLQRQDRWQAHGEKDQRDKAQRNETTATNTTELHRPFAHRPPPAGKTNSRTWRLPGPEPRSATGRGRMAQTHV